MSFVESLLWPLTLPYGAVSHLRARAYRKGILRQRRLDGFVISVGNLTTGGTGKTPMVLWIAQRLLAESKKAGILTRGYRGKVTSSGTASDEAQLLQARLGGRVLLGVGSDRYAQGQELATRGVQWFVLDDGFQHLPLARDVDIVLLDATNPFGGGHLLPAGRLREPRSALARADIVVITRSDHSPAVEAAIRRDSDAPIFYARVQLDSVRLWRGEYPGAESADARSRKLFAFSAIGNPSAFRADLRDWGFEITGHKVFPDHHRYTPSDSRALEADARATGARGVICTEKDIFNFEGVDRISLDHYYCSVSLRIDREEPFWRAILATAESRAPSAKDSPR
ncbi:MAG TPA: tetraacyldisaccharide 4'-kinase [Candidatus Acidoferrales bacterium]|nr:tetraacyldisaccharide 4'-kinase [Candidatus Acidoferrales bacterium]